MTIAFRADASDEIGNGHIMRCVTLANALAQKGERCLFLCRMITPPARDTILTAGHELQILPQVEGQNDRLMPHAGWLKASWQTDAEASAHFAKDCNWLVVDHYALDASWETAIKSSGCKIAVIDDLADRIHNCDLVLDQNPHQQLHERYAALIPPQAQKLFGSRYVLLRQEFGDTRQRLVESHNERPHIMVGFSGADPQHLTMMALHVLNEQQNVVVIANSQNHDLPSIEIICRNNNWPLHLDARNVASIMAQADVAIGAGGGMLWERAVLGIPSIAIIVADNQRQQVQNAAQSGLVIALDSMEVTPETLAERTELLLQNKHLRSTMRKACLKAIDGKGAARVAERIAPAPVNVRLVTAQDSENLWTWRNHPDIRKFSRNSDEISRENHQRWFEKTTTNPNQDLLVLSDSLGPLGVMRFDREASDAEVSIYLTPDRLGSGRGAAMLLAAERWLANRHPATLTVRANVLPGNAASVELFRSCGYSGHDVEFIKKLR